MKIDNIPIILHTTDSYEIYWKYWWHFFNKNCKHKNVVFCNEEKIPQFNNIKTYQTGIGQWGSRLLNILDYLNTDYIFYMQEDFWVTKEFPYTQAIIDEFILQKLDCWRICEHSNFYSIHKIRDNIYKYNQNSMYTLSHQFSLWKTSFLRKYIDPTHTPWQNETIGSLQINKNIHNIYYTPSPWYHEAIRKGKLKQSSIELLNKEYNNAH